METKSEQRELKVGDKIYGISHFGGKIVHITTIVRVTKTQAITKSNDKFQLKYWSDGFLRPVGSSSGYSSTKYYIENDNLKEKWLKDKYISRIQSFELKLLDSNELGQVLRLLNSFISNDTENGNK